MSENERPKLPVSIELGAKANLEVKAEIPPASAGRFLDALTDLIRPWSERRGLKADSIRLHREDVALEIARRAAKRIALENSNPQRIPLKVIVPLLEKGSQEGADDDFMIDRWANLLASAAEEGSSVSPRFVSLIGELSSRQARLLNEMPRAGGHLDSAAKTLMHEFVVKAISEPNEDFRNTIVLRLEQQFSLWAMLVDLILATPARGSVVKTWHRPLQGPAPLVNRTDLDILESLGLIEFVTLTTGAPGEWEEMVTIYCGVTRLGAALLKLTNSKKTSSLA